MIVDAGSRVGIIHYGEHTPLDGGYRPARMGQLATWLTEAGCDVTRFAPTFSPFAGAQRPQAWSGTTTAEGVVQMVQTRAYEVSVSAERLGFLVDFGRNAAVAVADTGPYDALIVGYPPPGVVTQLRRRVGWRVKILADIRDLWPDALLPGDRPLISLAGRGVGRALGCELLAADACTAMSDTMLARAPASRRTEAIPTCAPQLLDALTADAEPTGGLVAIFVGSFTQGFDFAPLFAGWRRFAERPRRSGEEPMLRICGGGEREDEVASLAEGIESIDVVGRVPPDSIADWLGRADVGISPTRTGFGTTLSNKIVEYAATGLFVLHSLEPATSRDFDGLGLGARVASSVGGWEGGFTALEGRLPALRAERSARRRQVGAIYGRSAIEPQWRRVLDGMAARGHRGDATPSSMR